MPISFPTMRGDLDGGPCSIERCERILQRVIQRDSEPIHDVRSWYVLIDSEIATSESDEIRTRCASLSLSKNGTQQDVQRNPKKKDLLPGREHRTGMGSDPVLISEKKKLDTFVVVVVDGVAVLMDGWNEDVV